MVSLSLKPTPSSRSQRTGTPVFSPPLRRRTAQKVTTTLNHYQ